MSRTRKTTKERCAELLTAALQPHFPGVRITEEDLWTRSGGEYKLDITRWGVTFHYGHTRVYSSWDTMSECVKYGLVIDPSDNYVDCISSREAECKPSKCPPTGGHSEICPWNPTNRSKKGKDEIEEIVPCD